MNALQSSKKTSEEVKEQLEVSEQTEAKIDSAREVRKINSLPAMYSGTSNEGTFQ